MIENTLYDDVLVEVFVMRKDYYDSRDDYYEN